MSHRRASVWLSLLMVSLAMIGGCADLTDGLKGAVTSSPGPSETLAPSASPSAGTDAQADNKVVLSGFDGGYNGLTSAFLATTRLGVRSSGVTTINLSDGASPGRFLSFRTYDDADFAPGKTFAIGPAPAAGTTPTSGSSLTYSDNGMTWVSTGGGQARMISREGYDTTFVVENVPMSPRMPLYLAGGASGSVSASFSGTFTSYSF